MSTTIEDLRKFCQAQFQEARQAYDALIRRAASGKRIAPEEALNVLTANEKAVEAFAGDVSREQDRMKLIAQVKALPAKEHELAKLEAVIDAALRERETALEAIERKFAESVGNAQDAAQSLKAEIQQAKAAQQELVHACQDPELLKVYRGAKEELQKARNEQAGLVHEATELRERINHLRAELASHESGRGKLTSYERLRQSLEEKQSALEDLEQQVKECEPRFPTLEKAVESAIARIIEA